METRTIYEERLMNVLDEVSIYVFGKPLASHFVKSRRRELVEVREMFCLLLREKTDYSYSQSPKRLDCQEQERRIWDLD